MRIRSNVVLRYLSVMCVLVLAGCGSSAPKLQSVSVLPATASIDNTTSQQFSATGNYSNGSQQDVSSTVAWTSSAPSVATISASGVASAVGNGSTTITATLGGISGTATLTVARTLVSITVAPLVKTIPIGSTGAFTATGSFHNSDGSTGTSDISSLVTWASSNTASVTIDNTGLATAVATGTSNITASLYGITSGNAVVTVGAPAVIGLQVSPASPTLAVDNTTVLTALELLSDNSTQPLTGTVTWSAGTCTPTSSVTISGVPTNGSEIARGRIVGSCTITATEGTLTGTSAITVSAASARYAYVTNNSDPSVGQYSVTASAAPPLTALSPATVQVEAPAQIVVHPNGKFVYTIDVASGVHLFNFSSGTLTEDAAAKVFAGINGNNYAVVDPSGKFLYVTDDISTGNGAIDAFTIDQTTGHLTAIASVTNYNTNIDTPEGVLIDRNGKFLYVMNQGGSSTVSEYAIQTDGSLTPLSTATVAGVNAPYAAVIDPTNTRFYVANSGDNSVTAYSFGSDGILHVIGTPTVIGTAQFILNVVLDPSGKYLYALDAGDLVHGTVFAFNLNADGSIGAATTSGSVQSTGSTPFSFVIDPSGTFMLVANNFDNTLSAFTLGSDGGLTPETPATVATGNAPFALAFYNAP